MISKTAPSDWHLFFHATWLDPGVVGRIITAKGSFGGILCSPDLNKTHLFPWKKVYQVPYSPFSTSQLISEYFAPHLPPQTDFKNLMGGKRMRRRGREKEKEKRRKGSRGEKQRETESCQGLLLLLLILFGEGEGFGNNS